MKLDLDIPSRETGPLKTLRSLALFPFLLALLLLPPSPGLAALIADLFAEEAEEGREFFLWLRLESWCESDLNPFPAEADECLIR